jgi:hypothetical protein
MQNSSTATDFLFGVSRDLVIAVVGGLAVLWLSKASSSERFGRGTLSARRHPFQTSTFSFSRAMCSLFAMAEPSLCGLG